MTTESIEIIEEAEGNSAAVSLRATAGGEAISPSWWKRVHPE
jgi:hypothetical protein